VHNLFITAVSQIHSLYNQSFLSSVFRFLVLKIASIGYRYRIRIYPEVGYCVSVVAEGMHKNDFPMAQHPPVDLNPQ
jgi:hypothetical protein